MFTLRSVCKRRITELVDAFKLGKLLMRLDLRHYGKSSYNIDGVKSNLGLDHSE